MLRNIQKNFKEAKIFLDKIKGICENNIKYSLMR